MTGLPISLYRADQVRELDRIAIHENGMPGFDLMQSAALAAFRTLQHDWPLARTITIICGAGNNAGDGYLLGYLARQNGMTVRVGFLQDPGSLQGDASLAFEKYSGQDAAGVAAFSEADLQGTDLVIDAILGTGLDREVSGEYYRVISILNAARLPVLAIDIPSGLNADTGQAMGIAVQATTTITFIGLKQGLITGSGRHYSGTIHYADLGVPGNIFQQVRPAARRMDVTVLSGSLTPRQADAHKGDYGHVLVVGGDTGFAGAGRMAAEAAARAGAGLVSLATRAAHAQLVPMVVPEIMARGVEQASELSDQLARASVIAIGPGLGQANWGSNLLTRVLQQDLPLVLDADALNLLARDPVSRDTWVLTPHPGEAARLLQSNTAAVMADRFAAVKELQARYGGVIVLKGSGTLVCDGTDTWCCSDGNPGMASGGMGDVLTGVIAALIAQHMPLTDAARLGVCLHAAAADRAAEQGQRGLLATDLLPWLRRLVNT